MRAPLIPCWSCGAEGSYRGREPTFYCWSCAVDLYRGERDAAQAERDQLRGELERTKAALADRKVIERAKGIVMVQRQLSEHDAFHLMRRSAMNGGKRLAEVARTIVAAAEEPAK